MSAGTLSVSEPVLSVETTPWNESPVANEIRGIRSANTASAANLKNRPSIFAARDPPALTWADVSTAVENGWEIAVLLGEPEPKFRLCANAILQDLILVRNVTNADWGLRQSRLEQEPTKPALAHGPVRFAVVLKYPSRR
jgi:hypothetical protein